MHEFSIASHLLELCIKNAEKNSASGISKITVKIGKFSGVEIHFLKDAFDVIKERSIAEKAELDIIHQDLVIRCTDCSREFIMDEFCFLCPQCGGGNIENIDGEEMMLMSMELIE